MYVRTTCDLCSQAVDVDTEDVSIGLTSFFFLCPNCDAERVKPLNEETRVALIEAGVRDRTEEEEGQIAELAEELEDDRLFYRWLYA